jgi:RNA polymerase sigma factor (sigma-70 family)
MKANKVLSDSFPVDGGKVVSINEYSLWKDFKSGDLSAYSVIYRKYFFMLYNYGKKISDDRELIEDCIQDLFIKIWNNRENLNETTSIKYYLFTSLKRKLLDTLKSPHQRLKTDKDVMDFEITDTSDFDDEAFLGQKEKILNAMTGLSKHQQRLLQMKFYRNQSNQEIAEELGITIQSVYNSVFKTLRSLRKQLQLVLWFVLLHL